MKLNPPHMPLAVLSFGISPIAESHAGGVFFPLSIMLQVGCLRSRTSLQKNAHVPEKTAGYGDSILIP